MSVLKNMRNESKIEYLVISKQIVIETIQFLTKLSNRYQRLLSDSISKLALDIMNNCIIANSIYPSSPDRIAMREKHLLEARGALSSLDTNMSICYEILMLNPSGGFETSTGKPVDASKAKEKLGKMSTSLGILIDKETKLITNVLKSDSDRLKPI